MSKSFIDIIAALGSARLRNHTGERTFSFTEGIYDFVYHRHSTGHHLTINVSNGREKMVVYQVDKWFSSHYDRHNDNTIQGFQSSGPWDQQVTKLMEKFDSEITEYNNKQEAAKAQRLLAEQTAKEAKIKEFAAFAAAHVS